MGLYTERGVVLHAIKYSENQLIIHILTLEHGRRSYIARLSGRGSLRALYQPLHIIEFQAIQGKGELHKISQAVSLTPLSSTPNDVVKSTITLFIAELLYRIIKDEATDAHLFNFVRSSVVALNLMDCSLANFHLHFMVRLSHMMGFAPQGRWSPGSWFDIKSGYYTQVEPTHTLRFDHAQSELLWQLTQCSVENLHTIALSRAARSHFMDSLLNFYGYHTESIYSVNSVAIFREIF